MKLFVFVLNKPEKLEDVLSAFVEVGLPGATILDSVGMGHVLARYIPVFAGFRSVLQGNRSRNKTIIAVVDREEKVAEVLGLIEEVCGPLDAAGAGIAFTIPIEDVRGLRPKGS